MKSILAALLTGFVSAFAEGALASKVTPLEGPFWRPFFKGAQILDTTSKATQFAGRSTISSGSATAVISTSIIGSDSIVNLNLQLATAQDSGFAAAVCVRSINPGNAMVVGWSDDIARAFDSTVMWEIKKANG